MSELRNVDPRSIPTYRRWTIHIRRNGHDWEFWSETTFTKPIRAGEVLYNIRDLTQTYDVMIAGVPKRIPGSRASSRG